MVTLSRKSQHCTGRRNQFRHTPTRTGVERKKREKKEKKRIQVTKDFFFFILRRNKAKRVTMTKKRDQGKGFGKDVGCHVGCGNPYSCERAVVKVLADTSGGEHLYVWCKKK